MHVHRHTTAKPRSAASWWLSKWPSSSHWVTRSLPSSCICDLSRAVKLALIQTTLLTRILSGCGVEFGERRWGRAYEHTDTFALTVFLFAPSVQADHFSIEFIGQCRNGLNHTDPKTMFGDLHVLCRVRAGAMNGVAMMGSPPFCGKCSRRSKQIMAYLFELGRSKSGNNGKCLQRQRCYEHSSSPSHARCNRFPHGQG